MLAKPYRLKDRSDVARVYSRGQSARSGEFSIKVVPNKLDLSRLTVVVSKKVAKQAPVRNRIRRRIYEYFRINWPSLNTGYDLIVSVFDVAAAVMPAGDLSARLDELVNRAGLNNKSSSTKSVDAKPPGA